MYDIASFFYSAKAGCEYLFCIPSAEADGNKIKAEYQCSFAFLSSFLWE